MRLRLYHPRPKKGRIEPVLVLALLLLMAILALSLWGELTHAFRLPSMSEEHEDLKDWVEQVRASDVQSSRSRKEPARRKASEDVHPMNTDNLTDMEETVYPSFDTPGYAWWDWYAPDWWTNPAGEYGTRPYTFPWDANPGAGGAWRVCRPEAGGYSIDCGECGSWPISQPAGDVIEITAFSGPGALGAWDNTSIGFCAYASAEDGQEIHIAYTQIPVVGGKAYPAVECEKTVYIDCDEGCECIGDVPSIYGDSTTIDPAGGADNTVDLWVGSGFACGPFTWEITLGSGFHFGSTSGPTTGETEEELEIITLYADASACGRAKITVTDSCGVSSSAWIRCTDGKWATQGSCSIACSSGYSLGSPSVYYDAAHRYYNPFGNLGCCNHASTVCGGVVDGISYSTAHWCVGGGAGYWYRQYWTCP